MSSMAACCTMFCATSRPLDRLQALKRIALNLMQIEGNQRPAQAGNIAVALNRVKLVESKTA